jgi:hypothetical protein
MIVVILHSRNTSNYPRGLYLQDLKADLFPTIYKF